jgi:hypothetical protein
MVVIVARDFHRVKRRKSLRYFLRHEQRATKNANAIYFRRSPHFLKNNKLHSLAL